MLRESKSQQEEPGQLARNATTQKSWIPTFLSKTTFSILGQASVGLSLITASLNGIMSSIGNSSAVACYIGYIKRKNAEVTEKNEKLYIEIAGLRQLFAEEYPSVPVNVLEAQQKSSYRNFWGSGTKEFYKDPLTYTLLISFIVDLANAGTMTAFLYSFESIDISDSASISVSTQIGNSTSNNSTVSDSDVDAIERICTCGGNTLLGKVAAGLGGATVLFAFPQIVAAHNLREYQNELRRERKQLKALINKYRQKQLTDRIEILEANNTKLSDEVISFFQDMGLPVIAGSDAISNLQELRKIFQEVIAANPTLVANPTLQLALQEAQQRLKSMEHIESSGSHHKHHHHKRKGKGDPSHSRFFPKEETRDEDDRADDTSATDQTNTPDQHVNQAEDKSQIP